MVNLIGAIDSLIKRHGGLRAAARAVRMDASYLSRLRTGKQRHPSALTLKKLGLQSELNERKGNHQ